MQTYELAHLGSPLYYFYQTPHETDAERCCLFFSFCFCFSWTDLKGLEVLGLALALCSQLGDATGKLLPLLLLQIQRLFHTQSSHCLYDEWFTFVHVYSAPVFAQSHAYTSLRISLSVFRFWQLVC